jgi:hypothetical protein
MSDTDDSAVEVGDDTDDVEGHRAVLRSDATEPDDEDVEGHLMTGALRGAETAPND